MFVIMHMLSWSCLYLPYFALKYIGAGKITGKNRQHKQRQIDVQEAREWQEVSSRGEKGEKELPAGAR